MTIKQNGGIFGRNPTFNDVETDGTLTVTGQSTFNSNITVQNDVNPKISILDSNGGFNAASFLVENGGRDLAIFAQQDIIIDSNSGELARFLKDGGLTFNGDTANSNALDDYEEGSWSPQLYDSSSTGGNASPTSGTGFYTKVGNTVTVWCSFSNISTSGMTAGNNVWLHGFPYSNGTAEGIGAVNCDTLNFGSGKTNVVVLMYPSNALALLKQTGDNVSDANTIVSDINSGTTDIVFTVTYKV